MPTFTHGEISLEVDEDGFMQEPDVWNKEVAMALATTEGVDDLTELDSDTTDANGVAFIDHTFHDDGEVTITAKFESDAGYVGSSDVKQLTVEKTATLLTLLVGGNLAVPLLIGMDPLNPDAHGYLEPAVGLLAVVAACGPIVVLVFVPPRPRQVAGQAGDSGTNE